MGNLVGDLPVKPGDGPAECGPLGGDDADMVGGEGLAEGAGIVDIHIGIPHSPDTGVPLLIYLLCLRFESSTFF